MLRFSVSFEEGGWAVRQDGALVLMRGDQDDAFDVAHLLVSGIKAAGGEASLLGDEKARSF